MSILEQNHTRLSPEYVLLGFLYQSSSHGYELHRRLVREFGYIWHASLSQTYNIIKRLEAQGYISATSIEQEKLPPKQELQITERGMDKFVTWLNQPTPPSVHAIRIGFVTRLYFMQLFFPEKSRQMIQEQVRVVDKGLIKLRNDLAGVAPEQTFNRLALELRVNLLSSVKGWLSECDKVIETQKPGSRDAQKTG